MISDASVPGSAVEGKFASLGDVWQNQVNLIIMWYSIGTQNLQGVVNSTDFKQM